MSTKPTDTVLVTGAAGFIAQQLIKDLFDQGVSVVGVDNFDPFYNRKFKEKNVVDLKEHAERTNVRFQFFELDICEIEKLPKLLSGPVNFRSLIHLAAKAGVQPSLQDPNAYVQANILGTQSILNFAKAHQITNILFGSSSSVYGKDAKAPFTEDQMVAEPVSPYAATKRAGELLCHVHSHLYQANIACLRFFTVYGPRQRPDLAIFKFTRQILNDETVTLFGDDSTKRDYTYVTDISAGIILAEKWLRNQSPGTFELINLGGSRTTSLGELVQQLETAIGKKAIIKRIESQPGDMQLTYADVSKARKLFGYEPKNSVQVGIPKFVDWFKSNH